jgi:hypothetical protein
MTFSKRCMYINTPSGDSILAELFQEGRSVTILLGDHHRIDLDADSAFELADCLLILANEVEGLEHEE